MNTLFLLKEFELISGFDKWITSTDRNEVYSVETDSRKDLSNTLFVPIVGEHFDAHDFIASAIKNGATAICTAQSLPDEVITLAESHNTALFSVTDTLRFYQQLAAYHRAKFKDLQVIAITGSCGKTSTKEIVASLVCDNPEHVLKTAGNTNNHIGVPQNLLKLREHHRYAVLELGTNHFGEIKLLTDLVKPDSAMITCIGGAHLEFFKDRDGVAREKSDIYTSMRLGSSAVVPCSEITSSHISNATESLKRISFGPFESDADWQAIEQESDLTGSIIAIKGPDTELSVRWSLTGSHQAVNAAGALAAVSGLGIKLSTDEISQRLQRVTLPGMRGKINQINGVTWINDAYNANTESTISTLVWLKSVKDKIPGRIFIVLGDMLELGDTALAEHQRILGFLAKNTFFHSLNLVGPEYNNAYENSSDLRHLASCYNSSTGAKSEITKQLLPGDTVFLKGSRGMKLELIVPENC